MASASLESVVAYQDPSIRAVVSYSRPTPKILSVRMCRPTFSL